MELYKTRTTSSGACTAASYGENTPDGRLIKRSLTSVGMTVNTDDHRKKRQPTQEITTEASGGGALAVGYAY